MGQPLRLILDLAKSRRAPIGAMSPDNRRKKVAEGKWDYVRQPRVPISSEEARVKIRKFEDRLFQKDYEHGVVINKYGNIAVNSTGGYSRYSFRLYKHQISKARGGKVFTHVHPLPLTLSPPDFYYGLYMEFGEIRETHSVKGSRMSSSWVPDWAAIKRFESGGGSPIHALVNKAMSTLYDRSRYGSHSETETLDLFHSQVIDYFGGVYTEEDASGSVTKRIEGAFNPEKLDALFQKEFGYPIKRLSRVV